MRVNSDFIRLLNNRWRVGSGVASVMLVIFLITSSFTGHPEHDLQKKQANLMIRQIGHRLLLQAGDSTSRVLPVTENKAGTFLLRFERDFVFDHDSLISLSLNLLPKTQFPSGYTVTVHDCLKAAIVYGFQVSNTSPDVLACTGRQELPGCYTIEFAFPDFHLDANPKKMEREKGMQTVELKEADIDTVSQEVQSFSVDTPKLHEQQGVFQTTTSGYPVMNLVLGGILVVLSITVFIERFGKNVTSLPVPQEAGIQKEVAAELTTLGKFSFDVKGQRLLSGTEVINLTDKECKVLTLLTKNFGQLIPRETLMQEIWINEGVITGRSLDMFVSKLRKKLSGDPELRITNVHGKGYKLETAETPSA